MHLAWFDAALDLACRAQAAAGPGLHAEASRHRIFALLLLDRHDEAEAFAARCIAESDDPALLSHACYARAILLARLRDPARRDYPAARGWIERALAHSRALPPSETRATNIAFLHNTKALVEMRDGNRDIALRLLTDAIDYLASEAPGSFAIESIILIHNRARLHMMAGEPAAALEDLTTLLALEPSNAEALFDRGCIHQRAGRLLEALDDYAAADAWAPPHLPTLLNRAQLLLALGRPDALVLADVGRGLALAPQDARLLCLRGVIEQRCGALDAADATLSAAVRADPTLADGWANRASVARRRGDLAGALADLDRACALREDAAIRCNRARVLEELGRWSDAAADYARARAIADGPVPAAERGSARCRKALDAPEQASLHAAGRDAGA